MILLFALFIIFVINIIINVIIYGTLAQLLRNIIVNNKL